MDRKSKLLAGIAAGAIALLVATTAAQCALRGPSADEGGMPEPAATAETEGGLSELVGTAWRSDDGKWRLDLMDGVMIESGEGSGKTVFYDVAESASDDTSVRATLRTSETQGGEKAESQLSVVKGNGSMRMSCDALERAYTLETGDASVEVVEATEDLEKLLGKPESEIAQAIGSWASTHSPYATKATWGKEAWVDYGKGTKVTTFYLDDASSTIVSVTVSSDGKLAVS